MTSYPVAAVPAREIDFVDLWRVLARRRWTIVLVATLVAAGAIAAAFLMTPVYRAQVLLAPVIDEPAAGGLAALAGQFGGLASLAGIEVPGSGNTEEAVAMLRSRQLTTAFIEDESLLPVLFAGSWDETAGAWRDDDDIPTMDDAYELFDEDIREVTHDTKTGLVTLSIEWTDPQLSADWANALVDRVNTAMRERAIDEADRNVFYLERELQKTGIVELQAAIYRLIESQISNRMLANTRDEYSFKVIDPAVRSDDDNFVRPQRLPMVALGVVLGLVAGVIAAFFADFLVRAREAA